MSKVEHYKWSDPSSPGRLVWIDKSQLLIDHTYQRDPDSDEKILKIARDFNWPVFGVLIVANRREKYFVVDGQHRLLGALKRADINKVPCAVFQTDGVIEEAGIFIKANALRTGVSAVSRFRAQIAQKDPTALRVQELVEASGRSISRASSSTSEGVDFDVQKLEEGLRELEAALA